MSVSESWRQIGVTVTVNLLSIYVGVFFGWTIVDYPLAILKTNGSEEVSVGLEEMADELSNVVMSSRIMLFTSILAVLLITVFLSERFGRRTALGLSMILFLLYAVTRPAANVASDGKFNTNYTIVFGGITFSMQLYLIPIYVHEISSCDKRGAHGVIRTLFVGIGMYLGYMKTKIWLAPVPVLVNLVLPVVYLIGTRLVPESPVWLARKGRTPEAKRIIAWLRKKDVFPISTEAVGPFEEPRNTDETRSIEFITMLKSSDTLRGLSVMSVLLICQAILQINCVGLYFIMAKILMSTTVSPSLVTALNIALHTLTCLLTAISIDSWGRRKLLTTSCIGIITVLCIMSRSQPMLEANFFDNHSIEILLMTLVILAYLIFYFLGMGSIPTIVALELIPVDVMHYGYAISLANYWITVWLMAAYSKEILIAIGIIAWCSLHIVVCILLLIVIWVMPETKAKPIAVADISPVF